MRTSIVEKENVINQAGKRIVQRKSSETNNSLYLIEIQMRGLILLSCSPESSVDRWMRMYSSRLKKK